MRRPRFKLVVLGCASLIGVGSAWSATGHDPAIGAPQEAIWRIQEFDLHFRGERGRYHSCSSLHQKISGIMEAIGAGSVIVNISCSRDALVNNALARVATAIPIVATPENVRGATSFSTEQAMAARLRGIELPTPETIERFPAEWRTVAVKSVDGVRLGPEDCDLLQDMNKQIFAHLTSVRIVRKSLACALNQHARPILIVEAFVRREA